MKKLASIILMLFSIHAYGAPLYVKLESDGDIIFSNTPIVDKKPIASTKNNPIIAAVTDKNTNNTHKSNLNAKPVILPNILPVEIAEAEESTGIADKLRVDSKPVAVSNIIPVVSVIKEENIPITHKSYLSKKSMIKPISNPIVSIEEEAYTPITLQSDLAKKSMASTKKEANTPIIHLSDQTKKSILQPKNKSIASTEKETNTPITHLSDQTKKSILQPKNKTIASVEKEKNILNPRKKPIILAKNKLILTDTAEKTPSKMQKSSSVNTKLKYKSFHITSPLNKEILQNQSALLIDLKTEPKLQDGDQIHLFIDGKHISKTNNSAHINAPFTKKGSHEIYVLITDKHKNPVIQSNVITIYIQESHENTAKSIQTSAHKLSKRASNKKALFAKNH